MGSIQPNWTAQNGVYNPVPTAPAATIPQGTTSAVTINITNPQAFSNGAVLPGMTTGGSQQSSQMAASASATGSNMPPNPAPLAATNPQQALMDSYNKARTAIDSAKNAYDDYMNMGRNLQNQAFLTQHPPQLLPPVNENSTPIQPQGSQPALPPAGTPAQLVALPAGAAPPAGTPVTDLTTGQQFIQPPQAPQQPGGLQKMPDNFVPPAGSNVIDMTTGQPMPSQPQPGGLQRMPDNFVPPANATVLDATTGRPINAPPAQGQPAFFNPGSMQTGPSIGPNTPGQATDVHYMGIDQLNRHIAQPTSMDDKLSAMEEVSRRAGQANDQTYNLLLNNLAVDTSHLTGAELMNATDSQRAAAMALSVLNADKNANVPTAGLPGFSVEQALIQDPNTSPETQKAILQGLRLLNRPQDPDIRSLATTAGHSRDSEVRRMAHALLAGKPLSLDS